MSAWKYTDATKQVVYRSNEDGSFESCAVDLIADWISEGNEPEPADVPPEPTAAEQITALEEANPITHRAIRELFIGVGKLIQVTTGADPSVNPAVKKIMELEAEIKQLRSQL